MGCDGGPETVLNNASVEGRHGGVQVPIMQNGTSGSSQRVDVSTWSSSQRKKFLIDYLMARVDHDDLLTGALLVACNNGLSKSPAEEQARTDEEARAAQEALFQQQENAVPFANMAFAGMPSSAPWPPPPPPMAAPYLSEVVSMQWLNAFIAENLSLQQSSVRHQQPTEMQIPMCASQADLLQRPVEELVSHLRSAAGRAAYEAR